MGRQRVGAVFGEDLPFEASRHVAPAIAVADRVNLVDGNPGLRELELQGIAAAGAVELETGHPDDIRVVVGAGYRSGQLGDALGGFRDLQRLVVVRAFNRKGIERRFLKHVQQVAVDPHLERFGAGVAGRHHVASAQLDKVTRRVLETQHGHVEDEIQRVDGNAGRGKRLDLLPAHLCVAGRSECAGPQARGRQHAPRQAAQIDFQRIARGKRTRGVAVEGKLGYGGRGEVNRVAVRVAHHQGHVLNAHVRQVHSRGEEVIAGGPADIPVGRGGRCHGERVGGCAGRIVDRHVVVTGGAVDGHGT